MLAIVVPSYELWTHVDQLFIYLAKEARKTRTWITSMKPTKETMEGHRWGFRGFYKRGDPSIIMSKSNIYGERLDPLHSAMGQWKQKRAALHKGNKT